MAGAIMRHLVNSMDRTVCRGHRAWENDIAANVPGGEAPLMGTLCSPMLGRWRPIEVNWKARTTIMLTEGNGDVLASSELYNPATQTWVVTTGAMNTAQDNFQMMLLPS